MGGEMDFGHYLQSFVPLFQINYIYNIKFGLFSLKTYFFANLAESLQNLRYLYSCLYFWLLLSINNIQYHMAESHAIFMFDA